MSKKRTNQWNASARRVLKREIASLLAQCWRPSDIYKILATGLCPDGRIHEGITNPKTQEPFTERTIERVAHEVWDEWTESASQEISKVRGEIAAHNREAEAAAWRKGDLSEIREFLEQRGNLYGAFAPKKIAPTDPTGQREYEGLTDEERARRIQAILNEAISSEAD